MTFVDAWELKSSGIVFRRYGAKPWILGCLMKWQMVI